jgi:hypothetical protein
VCAAVAVDVVVAAVAARGEPSTSSVAASAAAPALFDDGICMDGICMFVSPGAPVSGQ